MSFLQMDLMQMSFSGAVVIIAIIVVRAVLINRLPKKTFLILWGLALLRLLIPFSVPFSFSFYSLFGLNASVSDAAEDYPLINLVQLLPERGEGLPIYTDGDQTGGMPVEGGFFNGTLSLGGLVWFLGFLTFLLIFAICYIACLRNFKTSLPLSTDYVEEWAKEHPIRRNVSVRQYDRISSPLTYGILRPVILLPKSVDLNNRQQLMFILKHEFVHICRFDLVTKLIAAIALSIHWFNPFVWVFYILLNRDLELSCDEAVIRNSDKAFRADYARTLICMEEHRSVPTLLFSSFSKNVMEERIVAIMKPKKYTLLGAVGALALVALIATGFLTSAQAAESEDTTGTVESSVADEMNSAVEESDRIGAEMNSTVEESDRIGAEMNQVSSEWESVNNDLETLKDELEQLQQQAEEEKQETSEIPGTAENDTSVMSAVAMIWPTESITLSLTYGERVHPLTGQVMAVDHICIAGEKGDDVYAAISGTVTEAAFDAERGNYIVLAAENGMTTIYAHLESITVSAEDQVNAGDVIGTLGATGMATGPNLAFSVVVGGTAVDPMGYFE